MIALLSFLLSSLGGAVAALACIERTGRVEDPDLLDKRIGFLAHFVFGDDYANHPPALCAQLEAGRVGALDRSVGVASLGTGQDEPAIPTSARCTRDCCNCSGSRSAECAKCRVVVAVVVEVQFEKRESEISVVGLYTKDRDAK